MSMRATRRRLASLAATATLVVGLALLACGSGRSDLASSDPPLPVEVPDASGCGVTCSKDLKKVLQGCPGAETVLSECGPARGCAAGECVEACLSAEAAKGSAGCSFWMIPSDDVEYGRGACYAALLANTWDRPVTIEASLGDVPLDISRSIYTATTHGEDTTYTPLVGPVPPGSVAIVFLSHAPAIADASLCPPGVTPALTEDPLRHGTSITRAFHLRADAPVTAYTVFPYGGARTYYPSATLLLPSSSWERNYIAVSTADVHVGTPAEIRRGARTLQIVASEDGTVVEMRPKKRVLAAEGVAGAEADEPRAWNLARGQVLQISQDENLSGSPISANKPIGVFGGSGCVDVPEGTPFCDLTQQQIAPFSQWGREYALVPYRPRIAGSRPGLRERVPWSFVGAADGTLLEYEPSRPRGAPESLSAGQVATFFSDDLLVVRSQGATHPFHASVYMTGLSFLEGTSNMGDPEFVVIPPSEQFLDRYVFFVDYTYPETQVTVVRRKTAQGFRPVTLECAGELPGFAPLGTSGEYEYAWVVLTAGSEPQKFGNSECGYGRHEARSEGLFSVTVWGMGHAASYGYAGGMGGRQVNVVKPIPIR